MGGDQLDDLPPAATASSQPPPSMMMGTVGDTQPAQPTILTGDTAMMAGQTMFAVPQTVEKTGFRWGQFILGFFIPVFVIFGLEVLDDVFFQQNAYEEPWRYETIVLESSDERSFTVQFDPQSGEKVQWFNAYFVHEGHEISIDHWVDRSLDQPHIIWQFNGTTERSSEIGEFFPSNNTAFFELDNASAAELTLNLEYFNQAVDEANYAGSGVFEIVCFVLPVAYVGGIVASFVTGRKALGWGLLSSSLLIIVPLVFVIIALSVIA
jgi:hypothetical protein